MDADVVVVGAGPGGSAAAHWLARAGAKVVMLERARFPRDKSCGDGITGHSIDILHDMGVTFESFDGKGARTLGGLIGGPSGGTFAAVSGGARPGMPPRGRVRTTWDAGNGTPCLRKAYIRSSACIK